jgi:beta-aspartyl-peptidase (threonine type)
MMTHVALLLSLTIALGTTSEAQASPRPGRAVLVIHGGAGTISRDKMTPERDAAYRAALSQALETGYRIIKDGGTSLDAVEAAICIMEDSPLFNAGRGSVFTSDGHIEMDASIMDGRSHQAGAVASVVGIKNPIKAARLVMEKTRHVLLVGDGAIDFAREQGLEFADSAYFATPERWEQLQRAKEEERQKGGHGSLGATDIPVGTAGALALDHDGNLAAATSTGGLTNKRWGRVGDSPIIGAGTFADNGTCAVSCSGQGELFILGSYAHEVSALMKYRGMSVEKAAKHVIHDELTSAGGKDTGGLIALDRKGHFAMELNTPGMYRGYIGDDGVSHTFLYLDE